MPGTVVKTDLGKVALRFRKRAQAVGPEIERAMRETVKSAKEAAVGFSSARAYNPKRDKTHPYSRRRPHPPLPPFIINAQSGQLRRSWRTRVQRTSRGVTGTLYNTAPHAGAFSGQPTRTMIARPILQEVRKVVGPKRRRLERDAVRRALSKR